MKAAVCRKFGEPLQIEDVALADPGPGEITVEIKACAICHSDIHFAEGLWGGALPAVYGHEAAGIVRTVGPGDGKFAPGDPVVVTLVRHCGHCHYCAQGVAVACERADGLIATSPISGGGGEKIDQAMYCGAFAEAVTVHESQAVAIPPDLGFPEASLLACGVITGFGAVVNTARIGPGANVAVIGCGGVGLNCLQGASVSGARTIIAIDIVDEKLRAAPTFGATNALNARTNDLAGDVRKLTGGRGADYVFVSVGAKTAIEMALPLMAPTGALVLVGMPASGVMARIDPTTLANDNQRILGSKMGTSRIQIDIPNLVSLYQSGRLKLTELITGRFRLEEINAAFASTKAGKALRNVIVF